MAEPQDAESHARRACDLLAANKPREALTAAQEALALDPLSLLALAGRCLALLQLGKTKSTLQAAEDAIRAFPTDPTGHFVKAVVWARLRSWHKADPGFRRALELAPDHLPFLTSYGGMLLRRGDLAQAEEVLERCIALRQDDPGTILLRGEIAWQMGRREEARDCARWALSLDAKDAGAISLLTRSHLRVFRVIDKWIPAYWTSRRRLILPIIVLEVSLTIGSGLFHIERDLVRMACWTLSGGVALLCVSTNVYVRTRVRREMRDVKLRKEF
ncbi:tetratricopeptide repeat protein [Lichenicoccus sp.]|uniref:tetratricopeptide repeat protein n=1 Tax=Lichenicoccus sp. TaxID=2781899 RepID=UPI003D13D087